VTPASPINVLVKEAFIEGKGRNEQEGIERDGYSVRWTMENGLGLVFVVCRPLMSSAPPLSRTDMKVVFPALLPLSYIPTLLSRTKQLFLALFEPYLRSLVDSLHGSLNASATALQELRTRIESERWERIFERCLRDCEGNEGKKGVSTSLHRQAQLAAASSSTGMSI
jgi:signal recognition particle receptor subunit alpha